MYPKSKIIAFVFFILLVVGVILWQTSPKVKDNNGDKQNITSFKECVEAGYAVMESYPRQCRTEDGQTFVEDIGNVLEKNDIIRIDTPRPGATIDSPLTIRGEARGTWFFEATFPLRLEDSQGNVIAEHFTQTKGEWMTEDFVPYEGTISFSAPEGGEGTLVLEKANPSGLPENADALRIPVVFGTSSEQDTMTLSVYFSDTEMANEAPFDCSAVKEFTRTVPQSVSVAQLALKQLLEGPTESERDQGISTSIPDGVKLQSVSIENGVATADFSSELNSTAGSCNVTAVRAQIEQTLTQFPTVSEVIISVNGKTEEVLQP